MMVLWISIGSPSPERWKESGAIVPCNGKDSFLWKKDSYICSLHFVGQNGPTTEHPDRMSGQQLKERYAFMIMRNSNVFFLRFIQI